MVESSREHGHFDGRYPVLPSPAPRTWMSERDDYVGDQLDWCGFLTRFFPDSRRHDLAALAAYDSYKHRPASPYRRRSRSRRAIPLVDEQEPKNCQQIL